MQVHIIAVGKIKERFLQEGIAEYEKRLRPYLRLTIHEIAEERRPGSASPATEAAAMEKEGQRILAALPAGAWVIALDPGGREYPSPGLAALMREGELSGRNQLVFIIGGDLGLAPAVRAQSDLRLSLSQMTFTHPFARLLLMEQLYRACRINSGEPYHK
ncbi:MAG: 23S rRNA (pseudouridine(1915)-N(3))-methyltransferase RlmH [Methanomicrobiales archaeon]|nr:23S rRNA (pseudouridine(1915)-N(3))-methyltransferase RlmH [Methanomicrobiales archaeon]